MNGTLSEGASYEEAKISTDYLTARIRCRPDIGILCGTGLGELANMLKDTEVIWYKDIPGFPVSTAPGHAGKLVFGQLGSKSVVLMQGRLHFYEGITMQNIALPIRIMKLMGVTVLFVTNAAGGINQGYDKGDIMIIKDHIFFPGFAGHSPLCGQNDERFGPRFPYMSKAYSKRLRDHAKTTAKSIRLQGFTLREGVYFMYPGPSIETVSEARFIHMLGADAVGMSTCPEVIVAVHCGMEVFGISIVTNKSDLKMDSDEVGCTIEEVLETATERSKDLQKLIAAMVVTLDLHPTQ